MALIDGSQTVLRRAFSMPDSGWIWSFEKRIASDASDGREVVAQILEEMQRAEWAEHDVFGVHLAIEEALVNAIKHGNHKDPTKKVEVECRISGDRVRHPHCGRGGRVRSGGGSRPDRRREPGDSVGAGADAHAMLHEFGDVQ